MKSYRVLIVVVVVLVAVNCVLLGAFWYAQQNLPGHGGPPKAANDYLVKELKLTAAQQKTYDGMRKEHFELTRKLNEQNRMLRDEFFENIKTPVLNTVAADSLEKKITAIQASLDSATLNHFRKFRAILDAGQQEKFDHIIKNALHMMGGGPPQRGPGPGRRGMPPPPNGGPGPGDGQGPPPDGMPPPQN